MVEKYGEPFGIYIIDKLVAENKFENDSNWATSKKQFSSKLVTFNETPDWIVWRNSNYEIIIRLDYKCNGTHIVFKKSKMT